MEKWRFSQKFPRTLLSDVIELSLLLLYSIDMTALTNIAQYRGNYLHACIFISDAASVYYVLNTRE